MRWLPVVPDVAELMLALLFAGCASPDDSNATTGDPFADSVVSFEPGKGAGFGQDELPDVVLGSPEGTTAGTPSLDVLSLGDEGVIVLGLDDLALADGEGIDLLVFENPMEAWMETGVVGVSEDGKVWTEWPCDPADDDGGFPGCAGVGIVYAGPDGEDPTDPSVAGGDAFDLADIGVAHARYVRIRDSGRNTYDGEAGGFDLDAIAVVHGEEI
jgi:hypothetical protein